MPKVLHSQSVRLYEGSMVASSLPALIVPFCLEHGCMLKHLFGSPGEGSVLPTVCSIMDCFAVLLLTVIFGAGKQTTFLFLTNPANYASWVIRSPSSSCGLSSLLYLRAYMYLYIYMYISLYINQIMTQHGF